MSAFSPSYGTQELNKKLQMESEERTHYLTNALFKDGSAIDLLSGNRLVLGPGGQTKIGSSVTLGEQTYHASGPE